MFEKWSTSCEADKLEKVAFVFFPDTSTSVKAKKLLLLQIIPQIVKKLTYRDELEQAYFVICVFVPQARKRINRRISHQDEGSPNTINNQTNMNVMIFCLLSVFYRTNQQIYNKLFYSSSNGRIFYSKNRVSQKSIPV